MQNRPALAHGQVCNLYRAFELFVENDLTALPVVDGASEPHVIGLVQRNDITGTYLRHVHGVA